MSNTSNLTDLIHENSSSPSAREVLEGIIFLLLAIAIFIGNSMVILAVAKFRNLRSVTNAFVVCLAIADLFVGVTSFQLFTTAITSYYLTSYYVCIALPSIITFSGTASTCSLLGKYISHTFFSATFHKYEHCH